MHKLVLIAAVVALAGCSKEKTAEANADANVAVADANVEIADANAATPAATSLNSTSWTYTRKGKDIQESIDDKGNYVSSSGKEHVDHGTYVLNDGKHCFTSAMDKEGEVCWTAKEAAIGETVEAVSDKGEKLMVTHVAYVAAPPM
jgi:hypothetical protein